MLTVKAFMIITLIGSGGASVEKVPMESYDHCVREMTKARRDLSQNTKGRSMKITCVSTQPQKLW